MRPPYRTARPVDEERNRRFRDLIRPVSHDPDAVREWLLHVAESLETSPTALARESGLAPSTVNRFLKGVGQENFNAETIRKLCDGAFKIADKRRDSTGRIVLSDATPLSGRRPPIPREPPRIVGNSAALILVRIIGHVQAGDWQDASEWDYGDQYSLRLPIDPPFYSLPVVGLEVRGDSMDKVYPPGTIVTCVSLYAIQREPRSGERVVVQARRADGKIEATVKEFVVDPQGNVWLVPRSTNPDHKPIFLGERRPDEEVEAVTIELLVIGSYRKEPITP